jgi:hypothetical protein
MSAEVPNFRSSAEFSTPLQRDIPEGVSLAEHGAAEEYDVLLST